MKTKIKEDNSKTIFAILIILLIVITIIGTWFTLTATNWLMVKPEVKSKAIAYGKISIDLEEQKNKGTGQVNIGILPRPQG